MKNRIYPCLWFDGNAREAAVFYSGIFGETTVTFENQTVIIMESHGQKFMLLNGGPQFKINPSISFFITCESSDEVDKYWNLLVDGGKPLMPLDKYEWSERYGWLQDRFGVNWQLMREPVAGIKQKFIPALMYTGVQNGNAEKAINYYTSVFKDSGIRFIQKYAKGQNDIEGNISHAQFKLGDQYFIAMDSSYQYEFTFNEAVSLVVECETQDEVDYYWGRLTEGGAEVQCGWLKDKYGVSWQVVPTVLYELMKDPERSERVVKAFLQMKKFEISKLLSA